MGPQVLRVIGSPLGQISGSATELAFREDYEVVLFYIAHIYVYVCILRRGRKEYEK